MGLKKHSAVLINGFIVLAPIIITVYVVIKAIWWLDTTVRAGLVKAGWEKPAVGIGIAVGVAAVYVVGLLARSWLFGWPIRLGEAIVERIPLVKSLYSAIRDLLQFLGGGDEESRGRPAVVKSEDGKVAILGLITQENPALFLPGDEDRIGIYLPMSYQIGGYTLFVPRNMVEPIEDMSVEDVMKLTLTAGVGAGKPNQKEEESSTGK